MAFFDFDATTVVPAKPFEPVPADNYDAKITASEIKPTANGAGTRLNLTYEIIGGPYNGHVIREGLNVKHTTSEKAQQIGQEQLSAICHAVGVMNLRQTEQLHNIPMQIKVKVRAATKDEDGKEIYAARNEVIGWTAIGGGSSAKPAGTPAPSARPQPRPAAANPQARPATGAAPQQRPAAAPQQRPAATSAPAAAQRPAAQPAQRPVPAARPAAPAPAQVDPVDEFPAEDENNPLVGEFDPNEAMFDEGDGVQPAEGGESEDNPW